MLHCHLEDPPSAGTPATLRLEGIASIETAGELKNSLVAALENHSTVVVDCRDVAGVDLSFLQLLCAAHRTAVSLKKRLDITGCRNEVFERMIQETGFQRKRACLLSPDEKVCLWVPQPV